MGDLRRIRKIRISRNPVNNDIDRLEAENEYHRFLEESGAVESIFINEQVKNHCGCIGPVGGKCICGNYSCIRCHKHCGGTDNPSPLGCGKPICRECTKHLPMPDGTSLPVCGSCYAKFSSKKFWDRAKDRAKNILDCGIEFDE